jgi:hypothetical protein
MQIGTYHLLVKVYLGPEIAVNVSVYTTRSVTSSPQNHCAIPIAPTLIVTAIRRFTPLLSSQS